MNPEFQRNLWLELAPARILLMAGFVFCVLAIFSAAPPALPGPGFAATALYYFLVVLWGTRNAALSVIVEIRERTWDFQKLNAIHPFAMMWGKLFGSTSFVWFGGILCLPFIIYPVLQSRGPSMAAAELAVLILQGVLAQSVSLLTSLNLIRRHHNNWRLDAFLCQVTGIIAAFAFGFRGLLSASPQNQAATFSWWDMALDPQSFQSVSLAIFTAWALGGCLRAMRLELRLSNGPFVWLAFLAFLALYEAGFESWLARAIPGADFARHAGVFRLAAAGISLASSAYGMAFLEPKDPVQFRWLIVQIRSGRIARALLALDCWMLSFSATILCTLALAFAFWRDPQSIGGVSASALILPLLAALGFFTRDIGFFVLFRTWSRERGDFAAAGVLVVLYIVLPRIAGPAQSLLLPQLTAPLIAFSAAWAEAAALWAWTIVRIERRTG
ncbi:MAG TPA: hypothetical protein VKB67_06750 [Rhizomicrobium sp.]|nr:hypothetical protein [Rhizomicrobium sp.]